MDTKIKLGSEVVVSDPIYKIPNPYQIILKNVLSGDYIVHTKKHHCGKPIGFRQSMLMVIHEKHDLNCLNWEKIPSNIGVHSGQAGIFSMETYRNDNVAEQIGKNKRGSFSLGQSDDGDIWFDKICSKTIGKKRWGIYYGGVVSLSGFGDGSYPIYIAKKNKKIVGIYIDFCIEE